MIETSSLVVEIGGRRLLDGVSFRAEAGQVTGLIGPNGAGKSTLLSALSGDIDRESGAIRIGALDPAKASSQEMARVRAVMLQDVAVSFEFLVRDVVAMARRPWRGTSAEALDLELIEAAMAATDVSHLAGRDVITLSGGERARVALARVFAQQTPIIILDEPTAALDIRHQEQVLGLVKSLASVAGVAMLVVLHDLNAAAAYCDRIVCMAHGKIAVQGSVAEVYTEETLSSVYDWPIHVTRSGETFRVQPAHGDLTTCSSDLLQLLR